MRQDLLLDGTEDLVVRNGDLDVGLSDIQHVRHLFLFHAGEVRQFPTVGFGASNYLKKTTISKQRFTRDLKVALRKDGYNPKKIDLSKGIEKMEILL